MEEAKRLAEQIRAEEEAVLKKNEGVKTKTSSKPAESDKKNQRRRSSPNGGTSP
ncbi:MAG: hypothetical protein HWD58_08350 [Bacteroidota bacterium]|nr:MAG: hypothetical protein HWD58_08350 [Bacteroidota bacterium]